MENVYFTDAQENNISKEENLKKELKYFFFNIAI